MMTLGAFHPLHAVVDEEGLRSILISRLSNPQPPPQYKRGLAVEKYHPVGPFRRRLESDALLHPVYVVDVQGDEFFPPYACLREEGDDRLISCIRG